MKINISIVCFKNKISELQEVIKCCLFSQDLINQFFLIDNSPSNDIGRVVSEENKITYIFSNSNLGYGRAHNIALKQSIVQNTKYHLVMNPDITFERGTLERIVEYMDANPGIGLLMPKILYPDGNIQYLCKLLPTPLDWFLRRFIPVKKYIEKRNFIYELRFTGYNKIMEVPYLSGCFMFFRTKALKEVGLFDDNIFMYGEDTDLTRRMHSTYKTIYYPAVIAIHKFNKESYRSSRLLLRHIKSAIYYFNKWGWILDKERKLINLEVLRKLQNL